jgi:putative mRNA 3-end processing factor
MSDFWSMPLLTWTEKGLYCPAGDFYIDPHRAVDTAVTTHAHSDHARRGSKRYLCVTHSVGLLKARLGKQLPVEGIPYGQRFKLGQVEVSFHSAGHILGSAQVRVQLGNEVWVASGDYKREADPSCDPFEVVPCDTFITEATFGTPKYVWPKSNRHGQDIHDWWTKNAREGFNSLLFGYSLGKAQRILAELAPYAHEPISIHSTMAELTQCYRDEGRKLAPTVPLDSTTDVLQGALILAPPSVLEEKLATRLGNYRTAFASGWMHGSSESGYGSWGQKHDHGFVLSDHADWSDLNQTIDQSGAKQVYVLHRNGALVRHLRARGIDAHPISALTRESFERSGGVNLRLF